MTAKPIEPDEPEHMDNVDEEFEPGKPREPNQPGYPFSRQFSTPKDVNIKLSAEHRHLWWPNESEAGQPERWNVSADVWGLASCTEEERHIADIDLAITDLTRPPEAFDAVLLGEWAVEFIPGMVSDPDLGRLHSELEATISQGPTRLVVLRYVKVSESWRGHGLGQALVAGALRTVGSMARLAACRTQWRDFSRRSPDRMWAELMGVRAGKALERIGFSPWHGVHLVDLRSARLTKAQDEFRERSAHLLRNRLIDRLAEDT